MIPTTYMPSFKLIPLLVLTMLVFLLSLPIACPAATTEDPVADELKKKASQAFVAGRYAEAAAHNLEIAGKHPGSEARRYAVQMLGTLYEDNLVDIGKAIRWNREFLEKYATPQQVPVYKEKLASLEKLKRHEEAFAAYKAIRFANKGDEFLVKGYEALLKKYPDFLLKARVRKELGYAYDRLDDRRKSQQAFQELARTGGEEFSATDRMAYEKANRHWQLTRVWGSIAWGIVALLWSGVLLMKPWQRLSRSSLKNFRLWAGLWLLLSVAGIALYAVKVRTVEENLFHDAAVYIAAALNLAVLFWVQLLTRGKFWQTRPRALRWASPPLTLLMTTAVFYLFIVHQPNGTEIMDAFAGKYRHWTEGWWK